jgi:maltooligosyltrehalose trehalohydrolase
VSDPADSHPQGATRTSDGATRFRVWAPRPRRIHVRILYGDGSDRVVRLRDAGAGYRETVIPGLPSDTLYFYRLNNSLDRPDPASRYQPQGVHGPSQVVSTDFNWSGALWRGRPWDEFVIYESHVGTFTREGTFAAMIPHLDELVDLGVTALQVMPVAQFPGARNWGYDGVHPYAPQNTYGGPLGLKTLVDACHARGLAVVLDVVYNHVGPEGNYLPEFGPYFTDRHHTPWGPAINYDGPDSRAVREFFIGNALYWLDEFHVDALRLDATHAIRDDSPRHFLRELAERVAELADRTGRAMHVIAESNANDPRVVRSAGQGGYGIGAQLVDDFHRSLHARLTGERQGCYCDFGSLTSFASAYQHGYVLTGQFSHYRGQHWGSKPDDIPPSRFVVFDQCHDTVGNRPAGERLGRLVNFEQLKLAAAAIILGPCTPMLFMGEEYDDPAPFHYFTSHLDTNLGKAVLAGRLREFAAYRWQRAPLDPQAEETFASSRLTRSLPSGENHHAILRSFYKALLRLRRHMPAVRTAFSTDDQLRILPDDLIVVSKQATQQQVILLFHFGLQTTTFDPAALGSGTCSVLLDSSLECWGGPSRDSLRPGTTGEINVQPASCVVLAIDT